MLMVTGLSNSVSRYFTTARMSDVNPAGAFATLGSQVILIVNALGEGGSIGMSGATPTPLMGSHPVRARHRGHSPDNRRGPTIPRRCPGRPGHRGERSTNH